MAKRHGHRLRQGTMRAPTRTTLAEAAEDWLAAARAGIARTRSGDPYKPSALRSYEEPLKPKVLPSLGKLRLSAVDRVCFQDLVDRLVADSLAPSTVRNAVLPLRAIFRRAVARPEVVQNPTLELSLPAVRLSLKRADARLGPGRDQSCGDEPEDLHRVSVSLAKKAAATRMAGRHMPFRSFSPITTGARSATTSFGSRPCKVRVDAESRPLRQA